MTSSHSAAAPPAAPRGRARALLATVLVSLALHAGGLALAARLGPRRSPAQPPIEVAFEAVPPPPARATPARPQPAPAPRPIAAERLPPAPELPPPPPPNETPPPEAAQARAVPRVGVSLSSTVEGGGFAVGVGNTLHGKASEVASDPSEVRPYSAPASRLSAQPRLLALPEVAYPEGARRAGVEGPVVLLLQLDRSGRVVGARVLTEPGAGLGEAAREAALRFRFTPALLDGAQVETELRFTYTFVLE